MPDIVKIELIGRSHAVVLPDFAAREELVMALSECARKRGIALLRVYSAMVGLCTRVGRDSGADYATARYDVLGYGGAVYGWLRAQGASPAQIGAAATVIAPLLTESLFPRQEEVDAALGNSAGGAES